MEIEMEFHILVYPSPTGGFWVFNGFKIIGRKPTPDWQLWDKNNTEAKQVVMLQNLQQVSEAIQDIRVDSPSVADKVIIRTIRMPE